METINNTEPMPHVPQGANGHWRWDGHTTARYRNIDGSEWLLKGAWRWVQEQQQVQKASQAPVPVAMIAKQLKPTVNETIKFEKMFHDLFVVLGAIIAITLIMFAAL